MRFILALLRAILGVATAPLALLGLQPRLRASDVAAAAIAVQPAEPEVEPDKKPIGSATPFASPLGDLIKRHAKRLIREEYEMLEREPPAPLPPHINEWLLQRDAEQLAFIAGVRLPGYLIQDHVLAGHQGKLLSIGYVTLPHQRRPTDPVLGYDADKSGGRSGKGGPARNVDLQSVLSDLGYAPLAAGPRPR